MHFSERFLIDAVMQIQQCNLYKNKNKELSDIDFGSSETSTPIIWTLN